jgi:hypothetical protein
MQKYNAFTLYRFRSNISDNCSANLVTTGIVNTNVVGEYNDIYTATDVAILTTATREL